MASILGESCLASNEEYVFDLYARFIQLNIRIQMYHVSDKMLFLICVSGYPYETVL